MLLLCDVVVLFLFIHLQRPHCRILELPAKLLTWDQLYDFIRFCHIKVTVKFLRSCSFLYWPPLRWWIYVFLLVWSKMDQYHLHLLFRSKGIYYTMAELIWLLFWCTLYSFFLGRCWNRVPYVWTQSFDIFPSLFLWFFIFSFSYPLFFFLCCYNAVFLLKYWM
jgi:hypothetical protein